VATVLLMVVVVELCGVVSRCNKIEQTQKPEVEIFWREIQKLVMDLF